MKFAQGRVGRVFLLRLEDGDKVPDCLEDFAAAHDIRAGFCALLGGIGGGRLVVGPEDGEARPVVPMTLPLDLVHEAAALGTIAPNESGKPVLHMHAALGRAGQTITGCIRLGLEVWQVGEVVIWEILDIPARREKDPATGFELLQVD